MDWKTKGLSWEAEEAVLRETEPASRRETQMITRRKFLTTLGTMALGTAALGAGGLTYATHIEPFWLDVMHISLELPHLDPVFAGFRLAQISDIHLSEALTIEDLSEAFSHVLDAKTDLIALTGDYVEDRHTLRQYRDSFSAALRMLSEQAPVTAILGNHDYYVGLNTTRKILLDGGVQLLENDVLSVTRGNARLHIAGLDDVVQGEPRLRDVVSQIPEGEAAVLLAHEPDYAVISARTGRFDLQISGHSHGGQVVLPLVGAPMLPHLGKKYPSGLYQVGRMLQYTNRGLGTTSPHVRFHCRPEVTIITLQPGAGQEARRK